MSTIETTDWLAQRVSLRRGDLVLVDLRSPAEYERGSIPGSVNAPLLDNEERHRVGLVYKQVSAGEATRLGIDLFSQKADRFLAELWSMKGAENALALHCWRGGMRSRLVAMWAAISGLKPKILDGGYKRFRRQVLQALENFAGHQLLVLDGLTGSGKSDLLRALPAAYPSLDFERLACHRGSAFGGFAQQRPSPTQQDFENQIADAYLDVESWPTLLVEIENYIGPLSLPRNLRRRIMESPMVVVSRDLDDRIERLAAEYSKGWGPDDDRTFEERAQLLKRFIGKEDLAGIIRAVKNRDFETAVSRLLELRYDPVYRKGLSKRSRQVVASFNLTHEYEAARAFLDDRLGYPR